MGAEREIFDIVYNKCIITEILIPEVHFMNTCELSFDVRLDPGEEQYTDPSLETTLNEIRMYLDIIELARKL